MTKIVRMSEKNTDGTLTPFYPETHVEGLVGADSWQKQAITVPTGGPAINLSGGGKNLLDEIGKATQGLYTFYCPSNTAGAPTTRATRGLINKTSKDIGWVYSINDKNEIYTNYMTSANNFTGWESITNTSQLTTLTSLDLTGMRPLASGYDLVNLDKHVTRSESVYVTSAANAPAGGAGWLDVEYRAGGYAKATWRPWSGTSMWVSNRDGSKNTWSAWVDDSTVNKNVVAWAGGYHMDAGKVVTPSVPLSDCKAWIIYWSKYSGGEAKDYYFYTQVVTSGQNGGHSIIMKMDGVDIYKYVYISNTTITGADVNNESPNNSAVMRKVEAVL